MGRVDRFVYLNGEIVGRAEVGQSAFSSAVLYGKGVFTTISIIDSAPFLWSKHWRRLTVNAEKTGIDLSDHSEASIRKALEGLVAANTTTDGRARVTFFDEGPSSIWFGENKGKTTVSIITAPTHTVVDNLRLTISPYPVNSRSPLAGIKSCNYLENILAIEEAKGRGFDEAVRVNEKGIVAGGCMANLFWLRDGRHFTPSLSTGCLPGTTREFVLENVECDEVEAGIGEIENADAVFLTSAGLGVVASAEFNSRRLPPTDHRILRLIKETN